MLAYVLMFQRLREKTEKKVFAKDDPAIECITIPQELTGAEYSHFHADPLIACEEERKEEYRA